FQARPTFRQDVVRLFGKLSELPHRADPEAAFLSPRAGLGHDFQKILDVVPAERFRREECPTVASLIIISETRQEEVLFVLELGIESRLVDSGCLLQILKAG